MKCSIQWKYEVHVNVSVCEFKVKFQKKKKKKWWRKVKKQTKSKIILVRNKDEYKKEKWKRKRLQRKWHLRAIELNYILRKALPQLFSICYFYFWTFKNYIQIGFILRLNTVPQDETLIHITMGINDKRALKIISINVL